MKKLFRFLLFLILTGNAFAQQKRGTMGVGLSAGASNYEGDLDDDFTLVFTRPGYGAHVVFMPFSRVHFRFTLYHGVITANDAQANFTDNRFRNLNFRSTIDEACFHVMYTLQNRRRGFSVRNRIAPYVFAGIAYFMFNPQSKAAGTTYDLQKVGTEGQYLGDEYPPPYRLAQFSIPFGGGVRLKINESFDIGAESGFRKTFTDYLDDVSGYYPDKNLLLEASGTDAVYLSDPSSDPAFPGGRPSFSVRGNPQHDDWYVYTNINLTWYFTTPLFKAYSLKPAYKYNSCKGLN